MAKYHYDLTGAEAIIRDMAVFDATTLVKGEFVILDNTVDANCVLVSAGSESSLVDAAGIMNETVTLTDTADPGDAITTIGTVTTPHIGAVDATLTEGWKYGKVIINPFTVFLTEYSQDAADDVALTQAWSTTTLTLSSIEDDFDGGWILGSKESATSGFEGQLRYVSAANGSTLTLTVAPTVDGTTSDMIIKIAPVHSRIVNLNGAGTDIKSQAVASTWAATTIENYITTPAVPLEPLRVQRHQRAGTSAAANDLGANVKVYADLLLHDHLYNPLS